jgi:hypothetical protein
MVEEVDDVHLKLEEELLKRRGEVAGSMTARGLVGDIATARVSHNAGWEASDGMGAWRR